MSENLPSGTEMSSGLATGGSTGGFVEVQILAFCVSVAGGRWCTNIASNDG